tara:strand:+ start:43 stop:186 length:144 start_codon:yes stop_codon:yes gene_type:complete
MKETDAAYIAGLFDGEGSIYYVKELKRKRNTKVKDTEKLIVGVSAWK